MNSLAEKNVGRREFFRTLARYGVLGMMAVCGGWVSRERRRGGVDREAQRCVNRGVCSNCGRFDGCRLPAARSAKGAP